MAGLIPILFFVFLCALFYSNGLPLRRILKVFGWDTSIIVISSFGLALVLVAVTLGYKFGFSPQQMFWALVAFGSYWLVDDFVRRRSEIIQVVRISKIYVFSGVAAAGLMLAPILTGGINFALFQGNHIDAFNYLESAISYTRWSYSQVYSASPQEILEAGLFPFAATNLHLRPAITILYAVVSSFKNDAFLGLNYVMLVYLQFLALGVLWLIAKELLVEKPWQTLVLCVLIVGGFWGQYILDINAWSENGALPLLLMVLLLLLRSFSRERFTGEVPLWSPTLFAIVITGAFYVYPEATAFFLPGMGAAIVIGFLKTRKTARLSSLVIAAAVTVPLVFAVKENNIDFLRNQVSQALNEVDWWKYFDTCLLGRDGISSIPGIGVIDAGTSLLGGYMITPGAGVPPILALVCRGVLAGTLVWVVINCFYRFKYLASPSREIVAGALAVFVVQTVTLMLLHNYWSAGKAVSFFAFLLLLGVFCPLLAGKLGRNALGVLAGLACSVFLAVQGCMLIYRPIAAKKRSFAHYSEPYPAAMDRNLKRRFNFSDWTVLNDVSARDKVRVDIDDPWIQCFVKMLLLSHSRNFCVSAPVYEVMVPLVVSPSSIPCVDATCRLYLAEVHSPSFKQYLKCERVESK
jgi:hypothetical protein